MLEETTCCNVKRDLLKNNEFVSSIDIQPRVLECEKFTLCNAYEASIKITNNGMLPRRLEIKCDNETEKNFHIKVESFNPELLSGESCTIEVFIEPTSKNNINRTRHVYITGEHPNITFEVPIFVHRNSDYIDIPKTITFPSCPPPAVTCYEAAICNYCTKPVKYTACWCGTMMLVDPVEQTVEGNDYCKILLTLYPTDLKLFETCLFIKVGKECRARQISVLYDPVPWSVRLSTLHMTFEIPFGHENVKSLRICNESIEPITYKWQIDAVKRNDAQKICLPMFMQISPMMGYIKQFDSKLATFKFSPPIDFECEDENEDPPFSYEATAELKVDRLEKTSLSVRLKALITGPDICLSQKYIDCGQILIGEKNYVSLEVNNFGGIPGKIYFKEQTPLDDIRCIVHPESGILLGPRTKDNFCLMYYSTSVGKFLTQLKFKIKSGLHKTVVMRGTSDPVKVEVEPSTIEYGVIPFCIPQKCYITIKNLLTSPIMVHCSISKNGSENPLILNVKGEFGNKLLLNMKHTFDDGSNVSLNNSSVCGICKENCNKMNDTSSKTSVGFQKNLTDHVDSIAEDFLKMAREEKTYQQLEAETKTINSVMSCMLNNPIFDEFNINSDYLLMDWNALPNDPKEIIFEKEPFRLNSNEIKYLPIILIPNEPGFCFRNLEILACPLDCNTSEVMCKVASCNMATRVRLAYSTEYPKIQFDDYINLESREIYVHREYDFKMIFRNISKVPGFIFFKVVPYSEIGEMIIKSNKKMFIRANDIAVVQYSLIFRKVGPKQILPGLLSIIGKMQPIKFCIVANVLPPKIKLHPDLINDKCCVLEKKKHKITIENLTPTTAKYQLILKNKKFQTVSPAEGSLCSNEISFPIALRSCFKDFGIFKNKLVVDLFDGDIQEIPILFEVSGIPIIFNLDLKNGFDAGTLFVQSDDYVQPVKAKNCGDRTYKISFIKVKMKEKKDCATVRIVDFEIEPKTLLLEPKAEQIFFLRVDGTRESLAINEFIVEVVVEKQRLNFFRFMAKAKFINCQLSWSRRELFLSMVNGPNDCEKMAGNVQLMNHSPIAVSDLELNISGPFALFNHKKISVEKQMNVSISSKSGIFLTIIFLYDQISATNHCEDLKGKVVCRMSSRTFNPLSLKAVIKNPSVHVTEPEILFFTRYLSSFIPIHMENSECLPTDYHWQLLKEEMSSNECWCEDVPSELEPQPQTISEVILSIEPDGLPKIKSLENDSYLSECKLSKSVTSSSSEFLRKSNKREYNSQETFSEESIFEECYPSEDKYSQITIDFEDLLGSIRKFVDNNSDFLANTINIEETNCIQSAIKHVRQRVFFQISKAKIHPKEKLTTYIFLPPIEKGHILQAKFKLNIKHAHDKHLNINLVHLTERIKISRTNVCLGVMPWYKNFKENITIGNPTDFAIKFRVIQAAIQKSFVQRLKNGFIEKICDDDVLFLMEPKSCLTFIFQGIMGVAENFIEDIGIEVENGDIYTIRFCGKGQLPMISILQLDRIKLREEQIEFQYKNLIKIYEDFSSEIENLNFSGKSIRNNIKMSKCFKEKKSKKLDFEIVDKTREIPTSSTINRLIETARFTHLLNFDRIFLDSVRKIYCHYVKNLSSQAINPKTFSVESIPFDVAGYHLQLGNLEFDVCNRFAVQIIFHGSDRLILSVRTPIIIPGFDVSISTTENKCGEFFNYSPDSKSSSKQIVSYRNCFQRQNNSPVIHPKCCEVHLYDVDSKLIHHRCVTPKERKKINEYYTSLDMLSFKCSKNPLVINELYQMNLSVDNSDILIVLDITFKPNKKYYFSKQAFEDCLYVDIHLGPTIPILMHGIMD